MKARIWIFLILALAALLRFWRLTSVPPALDWDEVSNAYNGYSILKTGRDEFGESFPLLFRAFDGWVPPVLVYINTASTAIFGLGAFGARFPNAAMGVLTVWGVYLLVRRITNEKNLAQLASFILAISPWHIFFSRINVLPITPVFFTVFGTYFFLIGLSKFRFLSLSVIFFVLAVFSYFSAYVFTPLLAIFLAIAHRKSLGAGKLVGFLLPILVSSLLILFILPGGQNRLRGVSVFSDPDLVKRSSELAASEGFLGKIFHNRRLDWAQKFLEGYFANFRFDFLFGHGDAVERMVVGGPGFGLLYWWDLPFLAGGLIYLLAKKPKGWQIFISWLILAPIAAATALPQPASTRATLMIPAFSVIGGWGFWLFLKSKTKLVGAVLILGLAVSFLLFSHQYFVHFAREKSASWFYGYRELFSYLDSDENRNRQVHFVFGQHESLDQIHMFLLFYNRVDPIQWQAAGGTKLGCLGTTGQFSFKRYDFVPYECLTKPVYFDLWQQGDLIVTSKKMAESPIIVIPKLDGSEAFYVYELFSGFSFSDYKSPNCFGCEN